MRFSIIIPVYNVEKYIGRCMDTVMHQTFDDYEVIVVDDETPDNSMDIVRKYAEEFPGKIHMIRQKNTRQGGARNRGVTMAQGEYILFVDSDDYVHTDMLRIVDERLRENPCDILVFSHAAVSEAGAVIPDIEYRPEPGIYKPREKTELVNMICAPWQKAFRRSFYLESGFRFPEKILYEDGVTRFLYAKASTVSVCDDCLYYYVVHDNSSIRQKISEKMLDILTISDLVLERFQQEGIYEHFREPLDSALIYGILYIFDLISQVQPESPLLLPMAEYIGKHFPDYRQNPYVSPELARALDCLLARRFRWYHFRFLWFNGMKEKLLQIPVLDKLNQLRKKK